MNWPDKIKSLASLITRTGPLWDGTRLSGYADQGPYYCGNCVHLHGHDACTHPAVIADPETRKRDGLAIVNASHGCCEFVEPPK